jgi:hypothetical protein
VRMASCLLKTGTLIMFLHRVGMKDCMPVCTPLMAAEKLSAHNG